MYVWSCCGASSLVLHKKSCRTASATLVAAYLGADLN